MLCVGAYTVTLRVAFVRRSGAGHVPTQSVGTRHDETNPNDE